MIIGGEEEWEGLFQPAKDFTFSLMTSLFNSPSWIYLHTHSGEERVYRMEESGSGKF